MRAVNLSKLESRPTKTGLGRYIFFIDIEGSRERDLPVDAAITAIEAAGRRARQLPRLLPRRAAGPARIPAGSGIRVPEPAARHPRDPPRSPMAQQVLVLNATYEPINVCSLQRAVVLVLKNKAEVLERAAKQLRSATRRPRVPARDPARLLRARAAPRVAQDLAPRRVRPRRLRVPVLRHRVAPHDGPRGPALARRPLVVGQRRHLLRARATCARATSSPARSACTRAPSHAPRGRTSSSRSRPRGSRSPGCRTSPPPDRRGRTRAGDGETGLRDRGPHPFRPPPRGQPARQRAPARRPPEDRPPAPPADPGRRAPAPRRLSGARR